MQNPWLSTQSEDTVNQQQSDESSSHLSSSSSNLTFRNNRPENDEFHGRIYVGQGTFGTIVKFCNNIGETYACKKIPKAGNSNSSPEDNIQRIALEIICLQSLALLPEVVPLLDYYETDKTVELVMPYFEGGDLHSRLRERLRFPEPEAASICASLARFLHSAHQNCIMHRDLKPENILLKSTHSDVDICVTDFGLAKFFVPGVKYHDVAGTSPYMSPNMIGGCYGPQTDLWSLGVVLYFLLSGRLPFSGETDATTMEKVLATSEVDFERHPWPRISEPPKLLILGLLQRDEERRLTPVEVLLHPWIQLHCFKWKG